MSIKYAINSLEEAKDYLDNEVFSNVLNKYYGGIKDEKTLNLIQN